MDTHFIQWGIIALLAVFFIGFAPRARNVHEFFRAGHKGKEPGVVLLTGSLVIAWIMAKSITNSANLGLRFGIAGGFAYACYYFSFITAGYIIYRLRTVGNYHSIHHFLETKFGKAAMSLFTILIVIRLFNDVWSNTIVIGTYYGETGSAGYYTAIILFTALTLAYTIKGGLKTSLFTDFIQMLLFSVLLLIVCSIIFRSAKQGGHELLNTDGFSMSMAGNLILAVFLQVLSYPFHDPVLTDRAFITTPRAMLKSYAWATLIGFTCILLFSLVGVYAKMLGLQGQAAVEVAKSLGAVMMLVINLIMITSAASTLDSTFSSFSKLVAIDLKVGYSIKVGRLVMLLLAILGTIPVFFNPEILDASTISGTMVIGLAPVFICWRIPVPRISFFLSVISGLCFGLMLIFKLLPPALMFTDGPYSDLLWVNFWGLIVCFSLYLLPKLIWKKGQPI